ncbi:hypothetical protein HMF8227_02879 [Saliniradius amylolyticus]|uniref:Uncharacterized protein n=1 Tax=Saliniradius amylolyticus TaxID=2183582 RepID=A0A2S2E8T7_9ALTE|nr:hypothetical protein HMF8227_02879 [Saliniradius amylolyticus]
MTPVDETDRARLCGQCSRQVRWCDTESDLRQAMADRQCVAAKSMLLKRLNVISEGQDYVTYVGEIEQHYEVAPNSKSGR